MDDHAKIKANKSLYSETCIALKEAAPKLQVKGALNLWVFSNNLNHKIPKEDLHDALKSGERLGLKQTTTFMMSGAEATMESDSSVLKKTSTLPQSPSKGNQMRALGGLQHGSLS